jgi:SIR2-like domain
MPELSAILVGLETGTIVPFLGAGASIWNLKKHEGAWTPAPNAPVPSAGQLCEWIATESAMPEVVGANYRWDLALVSQFWASKLLNRISLDKKLNDVFLRSTPTTDLHRFLARFSELKLVITTNYDTVMETAWLELGMDFDVLIQTRSDLRGYSVRLSDRDRSHKQYSLVRQASGGSGHPLTLKEMTKGQALKSNELILDWSVPVLFKIHGGIHPVKRSGLVAEHYLITEDDYVDFLGNPPIPAQLEEYCNERSFLFLGYGMKDWNVRVLLRKLRTHHGADVRHIAIQKDCDAVQKQLWLQRGVQVEQANLADFLQELTVQTSSN